MTPPAELSAPLLTLLAHDRTIAFHSILVEVAGSVNAGLMLAQALYWTRVTTDPEGWFYKTRDEWQHETGLTRREQEGARRLLKGLLETRRAGMPAKCHYKLNVMEVEKRLRACLPKTDQLVGRKPTNKMGENRPTASYRGTDIDDHRLKGARGRACWEPSVDFLLPELQTEWSAWQTYRKQAGKPLTEIGRGRQVSLLSKLGPARAIAALRHSIEKQYTGIYEPPKTRRIDLRRPETDWAQMSKRALQEARQSRVDQLNRLYQLHRDDFGRADYPPNVAERVAKLRQEKSEINAAAEEKGWNIDP